MEIPTNSFLPINFVTLNYQFHHKPLIVGGKAKEFHGIRKAGDDIDLVIAQEDYQSLLNMYPESSQKLWEDEGLVVNQFQLWKTIANYDYHYLGDNAVELDQAKIISLEKLLFLNAVAMHHPKYADDTDMIVKKIFGAMPISTVATEQTDAP